MRKTKTEGLHHRAADQGQQEIVKTLIANGADVNAKGGDSETLHSMMR